MDKPLHIIPCANLPLNCIFLNVQILIKWIKPNNPMAWKGRQSLLSYSVNFSLELYLFIFVSPDYFYKLKVRTYPTPLPLTFPTTIL